MTIMEAIQKRHSVRRYSEQKVEGDVLAALQDDVNKCNDESGLCIRLVTEQPYITGGVLAKLVGLRFSGVKNYIVLAGTDHANLDEKAGYYVERLVLKAQQLGLNTCWVAAIGKKQFSANLNAGERIVIIVTFGFGESQGLPRKSKPLESLCKVDGDMPDWFRSGIEAAMLAPTALNRQKFLFTLAGNTVKAEYDNGNFSKIDLGIVKYHFEVCAGVENFTWL